MILTESELSDPTNGEHCMIKAPRHSNQPVALSSFVGRKQEIARAKRALSVGRLLTLVGEGGIGKTRLAQRVAKNMQRSFGDGVWVVELANLTDPALLACAVATAFGIGDLSLGSVEHAVRDHLTDKQALLVLDQCDNLLGSSADLVERVLAAAPGVRVVATARLPLEAQDERVIRVPPLSLPSVQALRQREVLDRELLFGYESTRLLTERAGGALVGPGLTPDEVFDAVQVCQQLEGVPLAIEMAAARLRTMSLCQLNERLNGRLRVFTNEGRAVTAQHTAVRASIGWSYDLCAPAEQLLWSRLSVFAPGFDLEAAQDVCSGDGIERDAVPELLIRLEERAVLRRQRGDAPGRTRFHVAHQVRRHGGERLSASGEQRGLRARHLHWYTRLCERAAADWFGPMQREWHDRVRIEYPNIRLALQLCVSDREYTRDGLRLAGSLWFLWTVLGRLTEGKYWLDELLRLDTEPSLARGRALWVRGWINAQLRDEQGSATDAAECGVIAGFLGDRRLSADSLHMSGRSALYRGELGSAATLCKQAWEVYSRQANVDGIAAMSLVLQGLAACMSDDLDLADSAAALCLDMGSERREEYVRSWGTGLLGFVHWRRGDNGRSASLLRKSMHAKRTLRDLHGLTVVGEFLAWLLVSEGCCAEAVHLFGALDRLQSRTRSPLVGSERFLSYHDNAIGTARDAMGEAAFTASLASTGGLAPLEALDRALYGESTHLPTRKQAGTPWAPLTLRERQVAELVSRGLPNRIIAETLRIAARTAEGHVEHILVKLGFNSRAQIAAWAVEQRRRLDLRTRG
ncbi:ATP-binding protein [Kutzneria albida]|uniref:Protein kinase/LuxR family transcription regulator n=1 Tax=Kutzneria albida DSM 43870 TaxID=1449976 RepID=W5W8S6_9PSEU|nr:LuxR C-terminal-related transcriptional regulator [Kutzneria albida]AHH96951.1 protein kinase/LuxR family transcription regulator [Kutzneria albida DSM 43870]